MFGQLRIGKFRPTNLVDLESVYKACVVLRSLSPGLDSAPEEPVCYAISYFRNASDTVSLQEYVRYITATIFII
jgi:hypothetical protein